MLNCQGCSKVKFVFCLKALLDCIPFFHALAVLLEIDTVLHYATPSSVEQIADIQFAKSVQLLHDCLVLVWLITGGVWLYFRARRVSDATSETRLDVAAHTRPRPWLFGIFVAVSVIAALGSLAGPQSLSPILEWFRPIGDEQILSHASAQQLISSIYMGFVAWLAIAITLGVMQVRGRLRDGVAASLDINPKGTI